MKYLLTGFFLILLSAVQAQVKVSNDTLHWNANRPLSWNDFKGAPSDESALKSQILCLNLAGFQRQSAHHQTQFKIVSVFDRMNSWMPADKQTDAGLKFYQVMFNIYELHSRKMREAYATSRSGTNPDAEFQEKYSRSAIDRSTQLNKFKRETRQGLDSAALETWRVNIDEELKALGSYLK